MFDFFLSLFHIAYEVLMLHKSSIFANLFVKEFVRLALQRDSEFVRLALHLLTPALIGTGGAESGKPSLLVFTWINRVFYCVGRSPAL